MKKYKTDFTKVSIIGRFAYTVLCAESYACAKYPEKKWKPLFTKMWKGTNEPFDEWWYRFMEILPEYLYEFDNYKDAEFEYLSEEDYNFYTKLLKDIDENMVELLVIPGDIAMLYSYSPIPGKGTKSIDLIKKATKILEKSNIKIPDPSIVEFSSFDERNGWGNNFDGIQISSLLK